MKVRAFERGQSASEKSRFGVAVKQTGSTTKVACVGSVCKQDMPKIGFAAWKMPRAGLERAELTTGV